MPQLCATCILPELDWQKMYGRMRCVAHSVLLGLETKHCQGTILHQRSLCGSGNEIVMQMSSQVLPAPLLACLQ